MNVFSIGSLSNYTNMMKLQVKWQQKQNEPSPVKGRNADQYADTIRSIQQANKKGSLYAIESKLKAGVKLSGSDMETLKKESPELYRKAVEVAQQRERYKQELAACRTKEDVERLRLRYVSAFNSEAKTIMNSNIPMEKKLEKMEFLQMRLAGTMNEHAEFIQSKEYSQLPSENDEDEEDENKKRVRKREAQEPNLQDMEKTEKDPVKDTAQAAGESPEPEAPPPEAPAAEASAPPTPSLPAAQGSPAGAYSASGSGAAAPPPNAGGKISVTA